MAGEPVERNLRELAGENYWDALMTCVEVRIDRREEYADTYVDMEFTELHSQIQGKLRRVLNATSDTTYLDSIRDLVNYSAFALERAMKQGAPKL